MTFELPAMTTLIAIVALAAIVSLVLVAGATMAFFVRNHKLRVARHEPVLSYYGHLVHGH